MSGYRVGILGATGLVGSHLMKILEERQFPVSELVPLASVRSAGQTVSFQGKDLSVVEATPDAFEGIDILLASAGASVSEKLVPEAVKRGAVVVDNTSFFRLQEGIPLVVAGVNDDDLPFHSGIIANPNCSTAQLMPVFKTLHTLGSLKRVIISTYQSVSGGGKEAMEELQSSTHQMLHGQAPVPQVFQRSIGFNLIPHIDVFVEEGYTKEETKLIHETRKILHLPHLKITATAVRVPVMIGHSEAVTLEFDRPVSPEEAMEALMRTPDVVVGTQPTDYHTPLEIAGTDPVYVSRIRRDLSNPETGLCLWVVADNLRIGAALNAIRIAEGLIKQDLLNKTTQPKTTSCRLT